MTSVCGLHLGFLMKQLMSWAAQACHNTAFCYALLLEIIKGQNDGNLNENIEIDKNLR